MTQISDFISNTYGFTPSNEAWARLSRWKKLFLRYNSQTNLMSKNDEDVIIEKHVSDSLSVALFSEFKNGIRLVDIGCGGGFPSLILAIFFPEIEIIGIDSVQKKTNFLTYAKEDLKLDNLKIINERCENIPPLFADIITSRAVGKITNVWAVSQHHLKKGGYFISYKAKTAHLEAEDAVKKHKNLKKPIFIPYRLPLKENFTRELVIFQKQ